MGKDKTLLPFKGQPSLTHYQYNKLKVVFDNVFVSAKNQKFNPPLPIIEDRINDYSPMLALYSILSYFKNEKIFIIPADMPFVEIDTIRKLYNESIGYEICVAGDSEFRHSLCGFFDSNLANLTKTLYEKKEHKIGLLFKEVKFKEIKFNNNEQFFNINYPKDYEKANL
ncbi:molybdenum cofactor guanylyltransferase protein A [Campylobacter blaseri]|nr:molybdenum cofactor guanylyltransferase protein A [Campylobacter blaseri]